MKREKESRGGLSILLAIIIIVAGLWSVAEAATISITDLDAGKNCSGSSASDGSVDIICQTAAAAASGTISGTVDPKGAMVFLYDAVGTSLMASGTARYVLSNPLSGIYTFTDVPYGKYYITPAMPGLTFISQTVDLAGPALQANFTAQSTICSQCGPALGQDFLSQPALDLCSYGNLSGLKENSTGSGWTWQCTADGQNPANCYARKAQTNGACGSASGGTFLTAPATNLCSQGTPSSVSGSSSWSWQCSGPNGGSTASCSANKTACGGATAGTYATAPTSNLCSYGNASIATLSGTQWQWTCTGNDSAALSCSASYGTNVVNGACGTASGSTVATAPTTNLCANGTTPTAVTGTGPWYWGCNGLNGGSNTSATACTAYKQSSNGGGDPANAITLQMQNEEAVLVAGGGTKYFKFTTPAGGCSTSAHKWLKISIINVDLTKGDGQLLVKSSNHTAAAWPTLADYTYEFNANGYGIGQDWTRDSNGGVFFWTWYTGQPTESLIIQNSYSGHASFSQDDTYYLLLYNQGTTQNEYRVMWQCS